jgi:LCP family protein required for cell wall assembly
VTSTTTYRAPRLASDPLRQLEGAPEPLRRRRAWWLLLLTLVLPGSAQIVAGNRRLGRLAVRVVVGVLAAVVLLGLVALVDRGVLLTLATNPLTLTLFVGALGALALGWGFLFLDAWRLASPRHLGPAMTRSLSAATAGLVLLTSGPLAYGAYVVEAQRELISSVFGGGVAVDAIDGRYNVLFLGGDAGDGRVGLRADSINLVSVDAETARVVQVGIPRNLVGAHFPADSPLSAAFPDGFTDNDGGLINGVYKYGHDHPELFPGAADPGAEAMKDAVEGVTGLRPQYYALVDMHGFEELIDALGGVRVDVGTRVPKASVNERRPKAWIEPGLQTLGGADALWFARSRFQTSDYERMARQRCVMSAVMKQVDPQTVLLRFQGIASASEQIVSTDIPQAHVDDFVELALQARGQPVTGVQLVPPAVDTGDPDFAAIRQMVRTAVHPPAPADGGTAPAPDAPATPAGGDDPEPGTEDPAPEPAPVCSVP